MLYRIFHWIGSIAIHWFYKDVIVVGRDKIPTREPLFVAVNHPNAMVDALVAGWVVPRRLTITAKATLFETPLGALLFRAVGMIPLRRMSDERARRQATGKAASVNVARNQDAFQQIVETLRANGAILIFPEGKSHHATALAPLKTGLARAALRARADGVRHIHIVPIGLTFEEKATPGTNVIAVVGDVIALDNYSGSDVDTLTELIAERLRAVSHTGDVRTPVIPRPRTLLTKLGARWGRFIHTVPIELARRLAVARSRSPDEPAMYTMTYGLVLTLAWYVILTPIVWWLLGGWAVPVCLFFLGAGAYYTAYDET